MPHDLTPREIVAELDRSIIGQDKAKRAVAVAVRNRWRRRHLDPAIAREVAPKNIIMVGPTGCGKTEIARRLAKLVNAPFVKVEASKYTEVGYHGRDVESMVRDLVELAITMVRQEHAEQVRRRAEDVVERRLAKLLLGRDDRTEQPIDWSAAPDLNGPRADGGETADETDVLEPSGGTNDTKPAADTEDDPVIARMVAKIRSGLFEDRQVEITVREKQTAPIVGMMGPDQMDPGITQMLENLMPGRTKRRRVTVARARTILLEEEIDALIDNEKIVEQALERSQESGIIFLDEIDKIAASGERGGADVSRQGVQRDLLPIVEGSSVNTRYGIVQTDQILFIAAGAFHVASVSDLMPELQGRFPIRVELEPLNREDFRRILTEPDHALTRQQQALLSAEGLDITFDDDAIDAIADVAAEANARMENIGARRLMTVMELVFEEISFDAPERAARNDTKVTITGAFVREAVAGILKDEDLSRFVL